MLKGLRMRRVGSAWVKGSVQECSVGPGLKSGDVRGALHAALGVDLQRLALTFLPRVSPDSKDLKIKGGLLVAYFEAGP